MNNSYLMNYYKHIKPPEPVDMNYDLDDFQDVPDNQHIYYQCYVDENNRFCYYETSPNSNTRYPKSALYKISKRIPSFFHRTILYFKYIPKFF